MLHTVGRRLRRLRRAAGWHPACEVSRQQRVHRGRLMAAGYVVLLRGGVVGTSDPADGRLSAVLRALEALFVLDFVGNLAGRKAVERRAMGRLTAALAMLCGLLAAGV
jgi:hypothetical protein